MLSLESLINRETRVVALTGAGISSDCGIPTYRDHQGKWLGSNPIQHQEFVSDFSKRQRYWARSAIGWPPVSRALPGAAHHAMHKLEQANIIQLLITQNVDRLHQKAGHSAVIDLHGRLDRVHCLSCNTTSERDALQRRLFKENPFIDKLNAGLAPDGDAFVEGNVISEISVPDCELCGGILKPDVVFFGGAVPVDRVAAGMTAIEQSDVLLVAGSSLMVYSGFRFARHAFQLGKPVIAINMGVTRADDFLTLKVPRDCGVVLTELVHRLELEGDHRLKTDSLPR